MPSQFDLLHSAGNGAVARVAELRGCTSFCANASELRVETLCIGATTTREKHTNLVLSALADGLAKLARLG